MSSIYLKFLLKGFRMGFRVVNNIIFEFMVFFRIFLLNLLFFCSFFGSNSYADEYYVESVQSYADSSSPALSRRKASIKARKIALSKLFQRIDFDEVAAENLGDSQILDLILEEKVMNEVFSANSYSASFNIRFSEDFVGNFLKTYKKQQKFENEISSMKILMVPIISEGSEMVIWGEKNSWAQAIEKEIKNRSLDNFEVIKADIHNMSVINSYNIARVDKELIEEIYSKYQVDLIYFLFYNYDKISRRAKLTVRGYSKSDGDEYRLAFSNKSRLAKSFVQTHVAQKLLDYIKTDGLRLAAKENIDDSAIRIEVPVRRLSEWIAIDRILRNSAVITSYKVESISKDFVKIDIKTKNSMNIIDDFAKMGFDLAFRSQDVYLLTVR